MATVRAITDTTQPRSPVPDGALRVGVAVWLLSEAMFFAGLFAAYFTLKAASDVWPADGVDLDTARAAAFTAVLVASSYTMHRAVKAAEAGRSRDEIAVWMAATVVLGAIFLVNQLLEYAGLDFGISSHAYGTIYYTTTGFHGLHVTGGLIAISAIAAGLHAQGSQLPRARTLQALGYFWHFVDAVWVVLFGVIFILR